LKQPSAYFNYCCFYFCLPLSGLFLAAALEPKPGAAGVETLGDLVLGDVSARLPVPQVLLQRQCFLLRGLRLFGQIQLGGSAPFRGRGGGWLEAGQRGALIHVHCAASGRRVPLLWRSGRFLCRRPANQRAAAAAITFRARFFRD